MMPSVVGKLKDLTGEESLQGGDVAGQALTLVGGRVRANWRKRRAPLPSFSAMDLSTQICVWSQCGEPKVCLDMPADSAMAGATLL